MPRILLTAVVYGLVTGAAFAAIGLYLPHPCRGVVAEMTAPR
ncbi:MAG TPA: hypothetical protein VD948_12555 [Rhodothermales bacterium]|nr:hypothetical protein [Rhodothermales bacterium]